MPARGAAPPSYQPRNQADSVLYRVIATHLEPFLAQTAGEADGRGLPGFVRREFEGYLRCGILRHGFARVRCDGCAFERLVPFSCKGRGFCPSCGGRRMTERAAHLVEVRPPLAQDRLRLRADGRVVVKLKAAWRDGTTRLLFEPLEFLAKLAALTPRPAINLLCCHGVLAPHARWRRQVVAYGRAALGGAAKCIPACGGGAPLDTAGSLVAVSQARRLAIRRPPGGERPPRGRERPLC